MTAPNTKIWNRFTAITAPLIFVLAVSGTSTSQVTTSPEIHTEHYPTGEIHYKVEVDKQQKPHGWSREYTKAGALKTERHYTHGVRDGISRLYYTTGELMTEWIYQNGKRHGVSLGYFKNGRLKDKGNYQNDLLEGEVLKYYSSGSLKARMIFKQDRLEGESFTYHKNGQVQHIYHYFKGQAWTRKDYSPEGKFIRKQEFTQPSIQP